VTGDLEAAGARADAADARAAAAEAALEAGAEHSFPSHLNLTRLCHRKHPTYTTQDAHVKPKTGEVEAPGWRWRRRAPWRRPSRRRSAWQGGQLLRTSNRLTLDRRTESARLYEHSP
jgi:hypothetical protein